MLLPSVKTSYFVISKLIETLPTIISCHTWIMTETEVKDNKRCSEKNQVICKIPSQQILLDLRSSSWIETESMSLLSYSTIKERTIAIVS